MTTPLTPTDVGGMLQKAYAADPQVTALFDDFPLWKLLDRVGKTGGSDYNIAVIYQAATRVGSQPASVYGQTQLAPAAQFSFTPKRQYGFSSIDGLGWEQSGQGMEKKAIASFVNAVHEENVAVVKTMAKNHALYLARGGTGTLGIIDTTTAVGTTILVLSKASDQYNFEEGQVLQVSATDGGAARAGTLTISAVPGNGTLVMTGNLNAGVAAIAVGDVVFLNGDGQTQTFPGLKSWCPFNAATKGTFGGVNRDLSPRRLAGFYLDATVEGLTIDAAISALLSRFKANKGKGTHGFLNPMDWEALAQTGSTAVTVEQGGDRVFGFKTLSFTYDGSKIRFVEDCTIPQGEAWVLDASKWEIRFVGADDIKIDDRDGLTIRKAGTSGADTWEMTFYSYPYGLMLKKGGVPGQCLAGCKLY